MPGPEGSYERWCVEVDAQHQLADHGPYRKWYGNGRLWVKGQLDMGRRTGAWTSYDRSGKRIADVTD
jgi:antitoxin component YwqK of YwqJK toxin-antitoxin module